MLDSLQQFYCDTCRNVIHDPSHGYVEFIRENGLVHSFRIVHHAQHSPNYHQYADIRTNNCYQHKATIGHANTQLSNFMGAEGLIRLSNLIDLGIYFDKTYKGLRFKDGREFTDFFRRVQLPYYEEARLYFEQAEQDSFIDGQNEVALYSEPFLKSICERYSEY